MVVILSLITPISTSLVYLMVRSRSVTFRRKRPFPDSEITELKTIWLFDRTVNPQSPSNQPPFERVHQNMDLMFPKMLILD